MCISTDFMEIKPDHQILKNLVSRGEKPKTQCHLQHHSIKRITWSKSMLLINESTWWTQHRCKIISVASRPRVARICHPVSAGGIVCPPFAVAGCQDSRNEGLHSWLSENRWFWSLIIYITCFDDFLSFSLLQLMTFFYKGVGAFSELIKGFQEKELKHWTFQFET